jgi:hypothetical protein
MNDLLPELDERSVFLDLIQTQRLSQEAVVDKMSCYSLLLVSRSISIMTCIQIKIA